MDHGEEDAAAELDHTTSIETLSPARNFKIPLAALVRAAAGPPACFLRKRRIEDLVEQIVGEMREILAASPDAAAARAILETRKSVARPLQQLEGLIVAHNRYYPVEANLPMDPRTGRIMERGEPWRPIVPVSFEALFACAIAALR